jgi:DNA-binding beta-propeller fold protein YncE
MGRCVRSLGSLGLLVTGCTASAAEVRPPADELFFPTGLAVSPDERHLFVVNANSQLTYDSGTVLAIDLGEVDEAVDRWLVDGEIRDGCERDPSFPDIIECDEAEFIEAGAGVRIGNFAANVAIQQRAGADLRLVVPVRGDPSVTWINWDDESGTLDCGDSGGFPLCDEDHRLTRFRGDDSLPQIDDEPYGVYVDSESQYAAVTHLVAGAVTLVDLAGSSPELTDQAENLFFANSFGAVGSVGVAGRRPGGPGDLLYVTSRSENRVQTFGVVRAGGVPRLTLSSFFLLDSLGALAQASTDARGIAFSADGDRAYVLNRLPPTVALIDTRLDAQGFPVNDIDGGADICREAVGIVVADVGDGERAYVSCFQDGELYVVDRRGGMHVEEVTTIGRGPFGIAAAPGRARLYIANFFDDSISVVDLTPGVPNRYRVALRIGVPER